MQLSTKHLLGIKELSPEDITTILATAQQFKEVLQRPVKKVPSLRDVTIVNLFYENSTRTRISFELAEKRLGADTINFSASGSSVSKGETLLDTVNNILSMKVDMVVMRHSASGAPHFLSKHLEGIPIVNAGDGINEHPTQALLDAFSIQEKTGTLKDKKILLIGDIMHSRVALSNIYLLKKMGAQIMLSGPPTLIPKHITEAFDIRVEYNLTKALQWCDVANVLRIQLERQNQVLFSSLREYNLAYGVTQHKLKHINKEIIIMHPGPINRGVEIDSDVADSGQSIILQQVENGVAVRMAVLYLLAEKKSNN
ncbi:MAG: aspartate carbamoyltransferase catalytic subunit [Bacteroidetes bacterium]|nr:aspartate carbamoyltransferase catalytic subunit [Bacteroidota bacterium]MBS1757375.1 aspartate carbamoyltransferase catalytic subunit [Bacteroidota bacterium]